MTPERAGIAMRAAGRRRVRMRRLRPPTVDHVAVVQFTRQLAVFVRAGVAITAALEFIAQETTDQAMRRIVLEMVEDLFGGASLSDAAGAHPEVFPRHYVGILRATEQTGGLAAGLDDLADHLQRDLDTRARLIAAITYPAVVLVLAVVTVAVLVGYVLPRFEPLFDELGSTPPLPTRILLGAARLAADWWPMLFAALGAGGAAVAGGAQRGAGRRRFDRLVLHLPFVGTIVEYSLLERFCRVLATMSAAGVPLVDGVRSSIDTVDNTAIRGRFETGYAAMLAGGGLGAPLAAAGLFPGAVRLMLAVGEETGTLQRQLVLAAEFLGRERDARLRRLTASIEPALIVFVGLVVGFVAVALVSAMYGVLGEVDAI